MFKLKSVDHNVGPFIFRCWGWRPLPVITLHLSSQHRAQEAGHCEALWSPATNCRAIFYSNVQHSHCCHLRLAKQTLNNELLTIVVPSLLLGKWCLKSKIFCILKVTKYFEWRNYFVGCGCRWEIVWQIIFWLRQKTCQRWKMTLNSFGFETELCEDVLVDCFMLLGLREKFGAGIYLVVI